MRGRVCAAAVKLAGVVAVAGRVCAAAARLAGVVALAADLDCPVIAVKLLGCLVIAVKLADVVAPAVAGVVALVVAVVAGWPVPIGPIRAFNRAGVR